MKVFSTGVLVTTFLAFGAQLATATPLSRQEIKRATLDSAISLWQLADYEPAIGKSAVIGPGSWVYSDGSAGGAVVQLVDLEPTETSHGYLVAEGVEQPVGPFEVSAPATTRLMERKLCCSISVCSYKLIEVCLE